MTVCALEDRNLLTKTSWLWLISLICLPGRCIGQDYYNDFAYSVDGASITVIGYTGPSAAVTIPASIPGVNGTVTAIAAGSKSGFCGLITSVTIPDSVTSIGEAAFANCPCLTAINVGAQNPAYSSLGGVLFDKAQTTLIQWPRAAAGAYTIPSGVTSIGAMAFSQSSGLGSVAIPNSVTGIGNFAFMACPALTNLTMGSGVTSIGGSAFADCSGLTSFTIPDSVAAIGDFAFLQCTGLTSAYFRGGAPATFGLAVFDSTAPQFSIYYPSTASGWSTPTWNGYPAQPYNYTSGQRPALSLSGRTGAVTPSFNNLQVASNYQLQVSTNLSTWSNTGPAFIATNTSEACSQAFVVTNSNQLFFRLKAAP